VPRGMCTFSPASAIRSTSRRSVMSPSGTGSSSSSEGEAKVQRLDWSSRGQREQVELLERRRVVGANPIERRQRVAEIARERDDRQAGLHIMRARKKSK